MALNAFDVGFAISVFDRASGPLNRIRSSYRTLNLETQKYEKRMQAGFKLLAGGYVAAASGIAAMGGALKLAQKAADFQLQIDQLKLVAAQSGIAESNLKGLESTVQKVAQQTTFSVTDITKASKAFVQRGLVGVGTTERGLKGAAIFSEISLGQIDIVKSSEIASQAIKAFRKEGETDFQAMERTLGIMANVANTTSLTFDKLPLTMGRIARAGSISGLALSELSVAVGKATDTMGSYRIAGTSVAVLLEQLSKGGKEKQLLDMFNLQGTRIKDVGLTKLIDAIAGQMKATGTAAEDMAKQIADKLEIGAKNVQILTGAAKAAANQTFGSFVAEAQAAGDKGVKFLEELVNKKYYETLGGQLKLLEGKFENFQINLGKTFAPALETITRIFASEGGLLDTINSFLTNKNNQKVVAKAAESFLKGAFMTAITGMTALLTGAVLLLGPVIAPMIPLMTALGGAVYVLTNNLAESFGGFKQLGLAIGDAAKVLITGDRAFLSETTFQRFTNANRIVDTLSTSFDFLKGVFQGIMTVLKPLISLVETLVGALSSLAGVFGGGEGAGGAGKLLGQVLMGGLLLKGAKGFLGGGAAAAVAGAAGGGTARGAAAAGATMASRRRGPGFLKSLKGQNLRGMMHTAVAYPLMSAMPSIVTGLGAAELERHDMMKGGAGFISVEGERKKAIAANRRTMARAKGMLKGRRIGARLGGGAAAGIAGAVGGAALGQLIAPDSELVQLGTQAAFMIGAQAAGPKLGSVIGGVVGRAASGIGLGLGTAGLTTTFSGLSGVGAAVTSGGIGGAAGILGLPLLMGGAIGTVLDQLFGFSDKISDAAAGIDKASQVATTSIRGLGRLGQKGAMTTGLTSSEFTVSKESVRRRIAALGGIGSEGAMKFQRELALRQQMQGSLRAELGAQQRNLDFLISKQLGTTDSAKIRAERQRILSTGDFESLKGGAELKQKFVDVAKMVEGQKAQFQQFINDNKLANERQEQERNAALDLIKQGMATGEAQQKAAELLSGGGLAVILDSMEIGKAVRINAQIQSSNINAGTDGRDATPSISAGVNYGGTD